jgi:hypothetical protein
VAFQPIICSLPFNFDPKVIRGVPESFSMNFFSPFTTLSVLTVLLLACHMCVADPKASPDSTRVWYHFAISYTVL